MPKISMELDREDLMEVAAALGLSLHHLHNDKEALPQRESKVRSLLVKIHQELSRMGGSIFEAPRDEFLGQHVGG